MYESTDNGARICQWDYVGVAAQQWRLEPVGNSTYVIRSVNSGRVLDVMYDSVDNGARICQWDYVGVASQQWRLEPVGNGSYVIRSVRSGRVLDVMNDSVDNGAQICQWDYVGVASQQWRLVPVTAALPIRVSLANQFPVPQDQGRWLGSCVAWAVSYGRTYQLGKRWNWANVNDPAKQLSPSYIYNQIHINSSRDGGGAYIADALKLIAEQGCDTLSDMPYSSGDYTLQPTEAQRSNASRYKTKGFGWYYIADNNINKIKEALARGNPAIIEIRALVPDTGENGDDGKKAVGFRWVWHDGTWYYPIGYYTYEPYIRTVLKAHVVCVIGYDDSRGTLHCIDSLTVDHPALAVAPSWRDVHACYRELSYSEPIYGTFIMTDDLSTNDPEP